MKRKTFLIAIPIIVIFLIGQQVSRYYKYDGNLIVCISNQSKLDSLNIELYIDGEKIISDTFTNSTFHNYKINPVKLSIGKHILLVKSKGFASQEITLTSLFIRWLIVDFFENDDIIGNDEKYTFLITRQLKPLVIE